MAVIFGSELRKLNLPFKVYGLHSEVAKEFDFDTAHTIETLLAGATAVVFGGGGAFLGGRVKPCSIRAAFDDDVSRLCDLCATHDIPIYLLSVGGSGQSWRRPSKTRWRLLQAASYVSFRNPEDSYLNAHANCPCEVFSDVVWTTRDKILVDRESAAPVRIAVDSSLVERKRARLFLSALKSLCRILRKQYTFVYLNQVFAASATQDTHDTFRYSGMYSFLKVLRSMDLVVTHRLHLGMAAMSYGVPALQVFPIRKAAIVFRRLGLSALCIDNCFKAIGFLCMMSSHTCLARIRSHFGRCSLDRLSAEANDHLLVLRRVLLNEQNDAELSSR